MKTIFKYKLEVTDVQELLIPIGARMLTVQTQDGVPCLWCLVDPDEDKTPYTIRTIGTGHEIEYYIDQSIYIGTYQLYEGSFIGHVFLMP